MLWEEPQSRAIGSAGGHCFPRHSCFLEQFHFDGIGKIEMRKVIQLLGERYRLHLPVKRSTRLQFVSLAERSALLYTGAAHWGVAKW